MMNIKRSKVINASVEKVFSYLGDSATYTQWMPNMAEVFNITGEGRGQKWDFKYKTFGMTMDGQGEALDHIDNQKLVNKSFGTVESTWAWSVSPQDKGTLLAVEIEGGAPLPIMGKVAEKLIAKQINDEVDDVMASLKTLVEGGSGTWR